MQAAISNPRTSADSSLFRQSNQPAASAASTFLDPVSTGAAIDIACPQFGPRTTAKEFLAVADRIVDQLSAVRVRNGEPLPEDMADHLRGAYLAEYLKQKYPAPAGFRLDSKALPARFKREPQIFLGTTPFSRTRRFLSRFIGDLAWRGVSL